MRSQQKPSINISRPTLPRPFQQGTDNVTPRFPPLEAEASLEVVGLLRTSLLFHKILSQLQLLTIYTHLNLCSSPPRADTYITCHLDPCIMLGQRIWNPDPASASRLNDRRSPFLQAPYSFLDPISTCGPNESPATVDCNHVSETTDRLLHGYCVVSDYDNLLIMPEGECRS
jgi:hypothetical protein